MSISLMTSEQNLTGFLNVFPKFLLFFLLKGQICWLDFIHPSWIYEFGYWSRIGSEYAIQTDKFWKPIRIRNTDYIIKMNRFRYQTDQSKTTFGSCNVLKSKVRDENLAL